MAPQPKEKALMKA